MLCRHFSCFVRQSECSVWRSRFPADVFDVHIIWNLIRDNDLFIHWIPERSSLGLQTDPGSCPWTLVKRENHWRSQILDVKSKTMTHYIRTTADRRPEAEDDVVDDLIAQIPDDLCHLCVNTFFDLSFQLCQFADVYIEQKNLQVALIPSCKTSVIS